MMEAINNVMVQSMDVLLGWLLHLLQDAALAFVALGTAAILAFVRLFTTNQDLLRRCKADKTRLRELIRAAKRSKDRDAVKRHRSVMSRIAMKTFVAEGKPLLMSIVPIAFLAAWSFARLACIPPKPGEPLTINTYFAASAIDQLTHIVPEEGLAAEGSWIRRVQEDPEKAADGSANGIATWEVTPDSATDPRVLRIRLGNETREKALVVDGRRYAPVIELYDDGRIQAVETALRPYKPFGVIPAIPIPIPGLGRFVLDAWLVGYLLLAIPVAFALRRLFGIL